MENWSSITGRGKNSLLSGFGTCLERHKTSHAKRVERHFQGTNKARTWTWPYLRLDQSVSNLELHFRYPCCKNLKLHFEHLIPLSTFRINSEKCLLPSLYLPVCPHLRMSVCLSLHMCQRGSQYDGFTWFFLGGGEEGFVRKSVEALQILLKSVGNIGHCMWRYN
jgi:hypothetical protein